MKKLVTILAILVFSVAMLTAASATKINQKYIGPYSESVDSYSSSETVSFDQEFFAKGSRGYWYTTHGNKIDFDPGNEFYGALHMLVNPAGHSMGGMSGTYSGGFDTEDYPVFLPAAGAAGARYPSTSVYDGYIFGIFNEWIDNSATNSNPTFSVYSFEDEEWTDAAQIISPEGMMAPGAWVGQGDVTFDAGAGEYVWGTTWEYSDLGSYHYCTVIGRSATPMDPASWVWSDYEDLALDFLDDQNDNGFKFQWGQDGLGIAFAMADTSGDLNWMPMWYYTTDYGVSWSGADIASLHFTPSTDLPFDFMGQAGSDSLVYADAGFSTSTNFVIDNNNKLHIMTRLYATDLEGMYIASPTTFDETILTHGFYDLSGTLDQATGEMTWSTGFIASPIGLEDSEMEYKFRNTSPLSIGCTDDGLIYASWLDRPFVNPQPRPYTGDRTDYTDEVFFSYSEDGGTTWKMFNDAGEEGVGIADGFYYGKNVSNTPDDHEGGFMVTPTGKLEDGNLTVYGACQYYDPDNLEPGATSSFNAEQFLHVWRITADDVVGINSENLTLTNEFNLAQNYPNPFNPTTSINFVLKNNGKVNLSVFNTKGEVVSVLANEQMTAGSKSFIFDASNFNSGVYFYQLNVNGVTSSKKWY